MTISQRIFEELKKQGKKQKDLAAFIGISTSAVSDWKKKGTNPAAENISAIADFLNISLEYLLTGEEKNTTDKTLQQSNAYVNGNNNNLGIQTIQGSVTVGSTTQPIQHDNLTKEFMQAFQTLCLSDKVEIMALVLSKTEK